MDKPQRPLILQDTAGEAFASKVNAEKLTNRVCDLGEAHTGAEILRLDLIAVDDVGNVFPCVVGGVVTGITAVVSADHKHVSLAHLGAEVGEP